VWCCWFWFFLWAFDFHGFFQCALSPAKREFFIPFWAYRPPYPFTGYPAFLGTPIHGLFFPDFPPSPFSRYFFDLPPRSSNVRYCISFLCISFILTFFVCASQFLRSSLAGWKVTSLPLNFRFEFFLFSLKWVLSIPRGAFLLVFFFFYPSYRFFPLNFSPHTVPSRQ